MRTLVLRVRGSKFGSMKVTVPFKFAARHCWSSKDGLLSDADVGQVTLVDLGMKPQTRKITHFEERFAGLDILAFERLLRSRPCR